MARPSKQPAHVFLNISSGGSDALIGGSYIAKALEEEIGPICEASPIMAAYTASAGFPITAGLLTKDTPGSRKPIYTARQVHELAIEDSRVWLPHKLNYVSQFLRSYGIKVPFTKAAFHYDQQVIKNALFNRFGDRTLEDMMASIYISGHNNSAKKAADQAVLFHREIQPDGKVIYNPKAETKILSLGAATTAVPGNMLSEDIDGNLICDFGHLDASPIALLNFSKTLEPGAKILSLRIGPPKYHNLLPADKRDGKGFIRLISHVAHDTSHHSDSIAHQFALAMLGQENVFDLSPDVNMQMMRKGYKIYSILDSCAAHTAATLEIADIFVRSEAFRKASDALGENAHLWSKRNVEATSLAATHTPFRLPNFFGKKPKKRPDYIQPLPQYLSDFSVTA